MLHYHNKLRTRFEDVSHDSLNKCEFGFVLYLMNRYLLVLITLLF